MCNEVSIERLRQENISLIVDWCREKDEDFLRQWAGMGYCYPLTADQISRRIEEGAEIFEARINGRMAATIEIISRNGQENSALVGRFVLDPAICGRGIGTKVMTAFLSYCKDVLGIAKAVLYVFDFNIGAHRCYQKCGFTETGCEERPNGWKAIRMEKAL